MRITVWLLASTMLFVGCTSTRTVVKWVEGDEVIGRIVQQKTDTGFTYDYENLDEVLVKREFRDVRRELVPGACQITYEYDSSGVLVKETFRDAQANPVVNDQGFAIREHRYGTHPDGNGFHAVIFLGPSGQVTPTKAGYSELLSTFIGSSKRLKTIEFLGIGGAPAPSSYMGAEGVTLAEYSYLKGVGELVYVVLKDSNDNVLKNARLSGQTVRTTRYGDYYGPYFYYYPY